jgi:hypothetical protein
MKAAIASDADTLILLLLSGRRGRGRTCCRAAPVANDPERKWSLRRSTCEVVLHFGVESSLILINVQRAVL